MAQYIFDDSIFLFEFTIRKIDTVGLIVAPKGVLLRVLSVTEDGAIAAWNRQCRWSTTHNATKFVRPGDLILQVNDKTGTDDMLRECSQAALLRFTIARDLARSGVNTLEI